jgi:hypothetical protein
MLYFLVWLKGSEFSEKSADPTFREGEDGGSRLLQIVGVFLKKFNYIISQELVNLEMDRSSYDLSSLLKWSRCRQVQHLGYTYW